MRRWDSLDWAMFCGSIFILLLLVFSLYGMVCSEQVKCKQLDNTSINHQYTFWTGCRAQRPNGMWVDVDDYYMLERIIE